MQSRIPKAIGKPKRKPNARRALAHLAFIRGIKICLCCGRRGLVDPAHVRKGTDGGTSLKPSDRYTVPLCRFCHERQHRVGEVTFWGEIGIDPLNVSLRLWTVSGDEEQGVRVVERSLLARGLAA